MIYSYHSLGLNANFLPTFIRLKPNRKVQLHTEDFKPCQIEKLEKLMFKWFYGLKRLDITPQPVK